MRRRRQIPSGTLFLRFLPCSFRATRKGEFEEIWVISHECNLAFDASNSFLCAPLPAVEQLSRRFVWQDS